MSSRDGSVDPTLFGNLVRKFGADMPVPFIENVTVANDEVQITLTMYFEVSKEQAKSPNIFKESIANMGINTYFMLLVSSSEPQIANNEANYNYEKFLKNIDKNLVNSSHIINYITPYFYCMSDKVQTTEHGNTYDAFNETDLSAFGGAVDRWAVYFNLFPQPVASQIAIFDNSIEGTDGTGGGTATYYNKHAAAYHVNTNAYKVPIENYEISDVFYSRDEKQIITMSAIHIISLSSLRNNFMVFPKSPVIESDQRYVIKRANYSNAEETFFGTNNPTAIGIGKMGIVSFSTLFSNLETNFQAVQGIQNLFRSSKDSAKLYKSYVSDLSHVQIMEDGAVLESKLFIYEDIAANSVDEPDVLQSINSEFYANDSIKKSEIVEDLNSLIVEAPENDETASLVQSLSYILSEFGSDVELLPRLNTFRSQIPDRSLLTPEGKFYESLKIKIFNSNQLTMQGRKLKRTLVTNPIVKDLRDPLSVATAYRRRKDLLHFQRPTGADGSVSAASAYASLSPGRSFQPFIYLNGHEIQGQIGLDPTFNPLSVPSELAIPPYFATDELGLTGTDAYSNLVSLFQNFYAINAGYSGFKDLFETYFRLDEIAGVSREDVSDFETYLRETGFSEADRTKYTEFYNYLTDILKPDFAASQTYAQAMVSTAYDISDYSLSDSAASEGANNKFTLVENGHFSFDYEKALGTMSNISLGLNTQKIDSFFGRDLLQSKFKVTKVRMDVHAMLISDKHTESGLGKDTFSTYDASPPQNSEAFYGPNHILLGSVTALFDDVLSGNPVTTRCEISKPSYFNSYPEYASEVARITGTSFSGDGSAEEDFNVLRSINLGSFQDYHLHRSMFKEEILTGYTLGQPSEDIRTSYRTFYDDAADSGTWSDSLYSSTVDGKTTVVENSHTYIALRNIGGIYNSFNPNEGFTVRQHPMISAPVWYDDYLAGGPSSALDPSVGGALKARDGSPYSFSSTDVPSDSEMTARDNLLNYNFNSYTHPDNALNSPIDYRLMTFEVQKVGSVSETILEDISYPELGDSVPNLLAFKTGIFPQQFSKTINSQFYEFFVEVEDNTYEVYLEMIQDLEDTISQYDQYVSDCMDNCTYNNKASKFNDFFINGAEKSVENNPSEAPWIKMPILYAFHSDLLNNTFNGDKDRIVAAATAISSQVSPRNGTRHTVRELLKQCRQLYNDYYSATAGYHSPRSIIDSMRGPVNLTFGRPQFGEHSAGGVNGTSAYVMIPPTYAYSGYAASYTSDLTDGYYYATETGSEEYYMGGISEIGAVAIETSGGTTVARTDLDGVRVYT